MNERIQTAKGRAALVHTVFLPSQSDSPAASQSLTQSSCASVRGSSNPLTSVSPEVSVVSRWTQLSLRNFDSCPETGIAGLTGWFCPECGLHFDVTRMIRVQQETH